MFTVMIVLCLVQILIQSQMSFAFVPTIQSFTNTFMYNNLPSYYTKNNVLKLNNNELLPALTTFSTTLSSSLSSFTSSSIIIQTTNNENDIAFEDAFTDQINFFDDSIIQLILVSFSIVISLSFIFKFFLNQMDNAIEKVLIDFENTMKKNYASRWVSIEAKIDGLNETERSQMLFEIMEKLQKEEPYFMEQVNQDMMNSSS